LDQSNFPEAVVVAGAAGGADVVGATVVLPERGGSPALFPVEAGSAAMAFNVRPSVAVPIQNLPKLQNLKNDRYDWGEDVAENSFDPVLAA
jgi:hypothetical protein